MRLQSTVISPTVPRPGRQVIEHAPGWRSDTLKPCGDERNGYGAVVWDCLFGPTGVSGSGFPLSEVFHLLNRPLHVPAPDCLDDWIEGEFAGE